MVTHAADMSRSFQWKLETRFHSVHLRSGLHGDDNNDDAADDGDFLFRASADDGIVFEAGIVLTGFPRGMADPCRLLAAMRKMHSGTVQRLFEVLLS